MTPKLLQKKSNRFLQLALPENLIANKRIGKREKYHHRPGAAANNLRAMEKRILGQWAFSWNMYKKRMEKRQSSPSTASAPEKMGPVAHPPLFPRARFINCTLAPFLVSPSLYILQERISRALGGNVIQYLKYSACVAGSAQANHLRLAGENTLEHHVSFFWNGGEKLHKAAPLLAPSYASPSPPPTLRSGALFDPFNFISNVPVHFGQGRGEMLTGHCRKNNFTMIYSLLAAQILQNKARGDRRDRIADHYRNQLAEWRKIAFLYGGLGRLAALRLQRRAHLLGGDVDSNFLSLLESRLDVVLKRAFFFSTLKAARQWIQRGKINVNNQRCTLAGTVLQPADIITISPAAGAEWRKERLRTLAASRALGQGLRSCINNKISHSLQRSVGGRNSAPQPGLSPRYRVTEFTSAKGWGRQIAFAPRFATGNRRFPFSPSLMRKWKEWSEIWSNSRYSFSKKHNWRTNPIQGIQHHDLFTGKHGQRGVSRTSPFYSSSCLANYLSARNFFFDNGPYLESEKKSGVQRLAGAHVTRRSTTCESPLFFSLLERRYTALTNLISPFSSPTFHNRQGRPLPAGDHRLRQVGPAKPQWQGVRRDKPGHGTMGTKPTPSLFLRLGQVIGGERTGRCQWLHQRQSNVVDGLHALRWSRGFARKKKEGEKKDQLSVTSIKPLHLECSYRLGTVIFLFFPQKLAWPSSINVSLLRKKLGG